MKCADVLRTLNDDAGNLEALRRHLEICPECSKRYASELQIEQSLRNLRLELEPVDIAAAVRDSLNLRNERRSRENLIRRGVWVTVSATALVLLIVAIPILAGWLGKVYDLISGFDVHRSIDPAVSSAIFPTIISIRAVHLFYLMAAVLAWLAAYLWREARRTAR